MNLEQLATVVGSTVTTFLIVGAGTIEAVTAAVGGDIGPGLLGVFAGVVAGLGAAWAVSRRWDGLDPRGRAVLLGYSAFGLTLLFLASLSYVNTPGVDEYLGLQRTLVVAVLVALVTAVGRWRSTGPGTNP